MKFTWKSFEDFSTIAVDKGMVEDHLPTAVMAGLKTINKQFIQSGRYDPKETERVRIDAREAYTQKIAVTRQRDLDCVDYGSVNVGTNNWNQRVEAMNTLENHTNTYEKNGTLEMQSGSNIVEASVTIESESSFSNNATTNQTPVKCEACDVSSDVHVVTSTAGVSVEALTISTQSQTLITANQQNTLV